MSRKLIARAMLPAPDELLTMMLDEAWDLTDAIQELEIRREKLRDEILASLRDGRIDRWQHPRGSVKVDRYASYKAKPSAILPYLPHLGWHDEVLSVKGRALHKLAGKRLAPLFDQVCTRVDHEVLVMTPARRRR